MEPTTIPAIWPPVSPRFEAPAAAAPVAVLVGVDVTVIDMGRKDAEAMTGSTTSLQRSSVSENTQHESVLFGELEAQNEQRLPKLSAYPQSLG